MNCLQNALVFLMILILPVYIYQITILFNTFHPFKVKGDIQQNLDKLKCIYRRNSSSLSMQITQVNNLEKKNFLLEV